VADSASGDLLVEILLVARNSEFKQKEECLPPSGGVLGDLPSSVSIRGTVSPRLIKAVYGVCVAVVDLEKTISTGGTQTG
jgi:hypothetical protein